MVLPVFRLMLRHRAQFQNRIAGNESVFSAQRVVHVSRRPCRVCYIVMPFSDVWGCVCVCVGGAHERRGKTTAAAKQSAVNILHITQSYYLDDLM